MQSGYDFPLGDTIVTWTATDTSGNSATATQTVTVVELVEKPSQKRDGYAFLKSAEMTNTKTYVINFDEPLLDSTDTTGFKAYRNDGTSEDLDIISVVASDRTLTVIVEKSIHDKRSGKLIYDGTGTIQASSHDQHLLESFEIVKQKGDKRDSDGTWPVTITSQVSYFVTP